LSAMSTSQVSLLFFCNLVRIRYFLSSMLYISLFLFLFFFNPTATSEIYTLSLHDALPIFTHLNHGFRMVKSSLVDRLQVFFGNRSEEHTSELQSRFDLVCRLLLEKKKKF